MLRVSIRPRRWYIPNQQAHIIEEHEDGVFERRPFLRARLRLAARQVGVLHEVCRVADLDLELVHGLLGLGSAGPRGGVVRTLLGRMTWVRSMFMFWWVYERRSFSRMKLGSEPSWGAGTGVSVLMLMR